MLNSPASSSSSTSSSGSSIHPASLVDPSLHSEALLDLVDLKVTQPIIDYLVDSVSETVDYAMQRPSRGRTFRRRPELVKFTTFVNTVLTRAEVTTSVILASLVYIERARPHLHIALEEWALERVFLGSLIVASKYLNDSTLKNVHWALCTGVFGKRDIGRIEREFLDVLDWELAVTESELLTHHNGIHSAIIASQPQSTTRSSPSSPSDFTRPHKKSRRDSQSRSRHHRRSVPVPELDSDSSSSSEGSSSPQTPSTAASSPARPVSSQKQTQKQHSSFHELLKSFPIPLPGLGSSHQYPMHVDT